LRYSLEFVEERNNIISALIDNEEIESVLLNKEPNKSTEAVICLHISSTCKIFEKTRYAYYVIPFLNTFCDVELFVNTNLK